jgi:hypothetical protein
MADARRAGMVDWDYLEDRTRELEKFSSWESPADILHSAAQSYGENLWQGQHFQPEDWLEKSALVGVIKPACERWRVPHMAARGYPSHSELYAAGNGSTLAISTRTRTTTERDIYGILPAIELHEPVARTLGTFRTMTLENL